MDAERAIAWRAADSFAPREFLGLTLPEAPPDHSTISRTRRLIDLETHEAVFTWLLQRLADAGLVKGKTVGIDATTLEANAALRSIVRRDTDENYQEFLTKLAQASGIETPRRADIAALARGGIGVLVSLLRDDEQRELGLDREAAACSQCQIEFVAVPVPDLGAPSDTAAFIGAVRGLAGRIRAGASVAVHCRQSVGRSGMLAVSVAVALGLSLESALDAVSHARGVSVPETKEQFEWLRRNGVILSGAGSPGARQH